ncbi:MAG: MFS transporter [Pseudomonadota bacterium]
MLAFPLLFVVLPLYVYAPEFYTAEYGIPLATIGFLLLGLRGIDAVQDLVIGSVSDRLHQYRKQVILVGLVTLALGFWIVFHPISGYPVWSFAIGMLLSATGFSILGINFQALGALWKAGINERTRITSWREAIGLIGLLFAAIVPTLLGNNTDAPRAFHNLTVLFLPILVICTWVFFAWMRHATFETPHYDIQKRSFSRLYTAWNKEFFAIYTSNGGPGSTHFSS